MDRTQIDEQNPYMEDRPPKWMDRTHTDMVRTQMDGQNLHNWQNPQMDWPPTRMDRTQMNINPHSYAPNI